MAVDRRGRHDPVVWGLLRERAALPGPGGDTGRAASVSVMSRFLYATENAIM